MPKFSHIWPVRAGHELPAKMSVLRIATDPWGRREKKFEEKSWVRRGAFFSFSRRGALGNHTVWIAREATVRSTAAANVIGSFDGPSVV